MANLRPITNVLSNVHRGTAFEERSRLLLHNHLSMSLRRVGGKSDGGIDLLGWWWLPSRSATNHSDGIREAPRKRIRILAQCKAEKKKLGPRHVREMEGVLYQYIHSQHTNTTVYNKDETVAGHDATDSTRTGPLVALLISESPFTEATTLRAQSSSVPFFLLHLPPQPSSDGFGSVEPVLGTAFWNPALAGTSGVLGGDIEMRWERFSPGVGRPSLWQQNQRIGNWTPEDADAAASPITGPTGST